MRWLIAYCVDDAIADRLNDSDDAIFDRLFARFSTDSFEHVREVSRSLRIKKEFSSAALKEMRPILYVCSLYGLDAAIRESQRTHDCRKNKRYPTDSWLPQDSSPRCELLHSNEVWR